MPYVFESVCVCTHAEILVVLMVAELWIVPIVIIFLPDLSWEPGCRL